jgi:hypothetical protein
MQRRGVFVLAGVFLVAAIVVPIVFFALEANGTLDNIIVQNPSGMQTGGNPTGSPEDVAARRTNNLLVLVLLEVVFIALFIVTVYYGSRA